MIVVSVGAYQPISIPVICPLNDQIIMQTGRLHITVFIFPGSNQGHTDVGGHIAVILDLDIFLGGIRLVEILASCKMAISM